MNKLDRLKLDVIADISFLRDSLLSSMLANLPTDIEGLVSIKMSIDVTTNLPSYKYKTKNIHVEDIIYKSC